MRIAIVNDVMMDVEALRRVLAAAPEHELAWVARDGAEALKLCVHDRPDLILMDLVMPVMDGVEATRRIMAEAPCAILLVTATVDSHAGKVFEALGAGALDVVSTPTFGPDGNGEGTAVLLAKIRTLRHLVRSNNLKHCPPTPPSRLARKEPLVVIGASAGGPAALAAILGNLPRDFPAAIVVIQHIDAQFASSMADWLSAQCPLAVRTVREGDVPQAGTVLLAATEGHLILTEAQTLGYTPEPVEYSYRPSIDVFFESVARHRKSPVIGIVLTGMGRDGARGLKALRDAGAVTIAQDQASCVVYGIPKAAIELEAAMSVLSLNEIAPCLLKLCV